MKEIVSAKRLKGMNSSGEDMFRGRVSRVQGKAFKATLSK
jgi:hypothetical protein